jgi:hypothetical protein
MSSYSRCCWRCGRVPHRATIPAHGAGCSARATTARHGCRRIVGKSSPVPSRSRSAQPMSTICFWERRAGSYAREMAGGTGPSKRQESWSVPSSRWPSPRTGNGRWFRLALGSLAAKPGTAGGRRRLLRAQRRLEPLFAAEKPVASIWPAGPDYIAAMIGARRGRALAASPMKPRQRYSWCTAHPRRFTPS